MKSAAMNVTPEWLDGYLSAVTVAPIMESPTSWITGLLDQAADFVDETEMQRFLDLIMHRYNAANVDLPDSESTKLRFDEMPSTIRKNWAQGFSENVARYPESWPSKLLNRDDAEILKAIAVGAQNVVEFDTIITVLPAWL